MILCTVSFNDNDASVWARDDDAEVHFKKQLFGLEADIFSGIPRVTGIPRESRGMGNKIATNHVIGTGQEKI